MNNQAKIVAAHIIHGVPAEWEEYLHLLLEHSRERDIQINFNQPPQPFPKQLRNPCVLKEYKDGSCEYVSSQIWLSISASGERTIIEPQETSGVLIEGETGRILKPFNKLPEVTPRDARHLIRILIRKGIDARTKQQRESMTWTLYTNTYS